MCKQLTHLCTLCIINVYTDTNIKFFRCTNFVPTPMTVPLNQAATRGTPAAGTVTGRELWRPRQGPRAQRSPSLCVPDLCIEEW